MNCRITENENLAPFCTMKVGGYAKYAAFPKTQEELTEAVSFFRASGTDFIVAGNCSNMIFADEFFDGAVIFLNGIKGISVCENGNIKAFCGETLSSLAIFACENSIKGFEFCYGIPGTVGGGVFMNAGAYGGEISDIFIKGTFIAPDGEIKELFLNKMDFSYRHSVINENGYILVSAEFKGRKGSKEEIRKSMDDFMARRKKSQPLEFPSCGSTFKRPCGHYAGALIEQCGLKGFSVGGAQVSQKHAGFVINRGKASVDDVLMLIEEVRNRVFKKTDIMLEPEIRIIKTSGGK